MEPIAGRDERRLSCSATRRQSHRENRRIGYRTAVPSSLDSGTLFVWRETDVVPAPRRGPAEEGQAWAFAPT